MTKAETSLNKMIGITGGIGSGKSTVSKRLANRISAAIVDADKISRELTLKDGIAIPFIRKEFGDEFISDNAMDRKKMRDLIFTNPSQKKKLESILSPLIKQGMLDEIQTAFNLGKDVVVDIPLLVESPYWLKVLNPIIAVDCSLDSQVKRVMQRNNLPENEVMNIINSQSTSQQRKNIANYVLTNDNLEDLDSKIEDLVTELKL